VNKLLHMPTIRLKEAATAPEGARYAETVRRLFDLGEEDSMIGRDPSEHARSNR
jgi:hypothetical protein